MWHGKNGGRGGGLRTPRAAGIVPRTQGSSLSSSFFGTFWYMLLKSLEVGQARKEGRKKPWFIYSGSSLSVIFPPAKIDQFAFVVDVQLLPPPPLLDTFSKLSTVMHFPSLSLFLRVFSLRCSFPLFFSKGEGVKKKSASKRFRNYSRIIGPLLT